MVRLSSVLITLAWWGYCRARVAGLLTLVALAATAALLHARSWDTELYTLLPVGSRERADIEQLARELGPGQDIVVLVSGQEAGQRKAYVERLQRQLKSDPERYRSVLGSLDLGFLRPTVLYHLKPAELHALETAARNLRPLLQAGNANALLARADTKAPTPRRSEVLLQLALHYLGQLETAIEERGRAHFVSPVWSFVDKKQLDPRAVALWEGKPVTHYTTLSNGQIHALVLSAGPMGLPTALRGVRYEAARIAQQFPGIRAEVTGAGAIVSEQRAALVKDLARCGGVALLGLLLLFGLVYRDVYRPLAAAAASLLGSVSLFALLAPAGIPAGLGLFLGAAAGLCFSLRLACSYCEQRRKGNFPLNAWRSAMLGPGTGFVAGVLTLGTAFLTLVLTGFPGAIQVGMGGALGLIGAFLGTLLWLPGLIGLFDPFPRRAPALTDVRLRKLERWVRARKRPAALAAAVLLTIGAVSAGTTYLHTDPALLFDRKLPATAALLHLEHVGHTNLSLLALVPDADQARELTRRLRRLPFVGRVESGAILLPEGALGKEPIVRRIHAEVKGLKLPAPRQSIELEGMGELAPVVTRFEATIARMGEQSPKARQLAATIQGKLDGLKADLPELGPGPIEDGVLAFEQGCTKDLESLIQLMSSQSLKAPGPALLPPEVRQRTVSASGQMVVKIYPRTGGFKPEEAAGFVSNVQALHPEASGSAVLLARLGELSQRACAAAGGFIWLSVLGVVVLQVGSLRKALLVMLAPTLAWLWTVGVLALCRTPLNLATFLLPPVLLGLGATLAVESRRRKQARGGRPLLMALLATAVVSVSLCLADSPALSSLGLVLFIGLASNWLAVSCLPTPVRALRKKRKTARPWRLRRGASRPSLSQLPS